jgi:hypothetical protein
LEKLRLDPNAQPSDEPLAKPQRRLAWLRDEPGNREMWALGLLLTLLSGLPS